MASISEVMQGQGFTPEQIAQVEEKRKRDAADPWQTVQKIADKAFRDMRNARKGFPDLTDHETYQAHSRLVIFLANTVCLAPQRRKFIIDERNKDILRFLLYYFNDCPLAEEVFPDRRYKLDKNIMLMGGVGVGKTMMMQIFSEYLRRTENPNFFHNLSVTQMVNYYTLHNNLDLYTYNEDSSVGFQVKPVNVCLNDVGLESRPFYGMDTKVLTNEFLHARNEIWVHYGKKAHITTNLTVEELQEAFKDEFGGRLIDRFKTYNVIEMGGQSRR